MSYLFKCMEQRCNSALTVTSNSTLSKPATSIVHALCGLALMMSVLTPNFTFAQTQADIATAQRQSEIIQRQEQERIERDQEAARRLPDRIDGIDTRSLLPKIEVPSIGAACRQISSISINGAPNLSLSERQRIIGEFIGHCLNVRDIERILAQITKYYVDRGFITTRAYLPQQDLSKGHLEILVVEGVVEKILIEDGNAKSVSPENVFPRVAGNLLNLRDLEQGIDQINRLSSNSAQLDIQPGEKTGASRVVVRNAPRSPYHLSLSGDNQGSEATGKRQAGLTAGVDNFLGFNENISATHRESVPHDPDHRFSDSDNINFSIPFGYTTFSLGTSYSSYVSTIRVPSGLDLISRGNNKTDNVRLDRVMYRNQSTRFSLAATLATKAARNYLDDQFLGVSSRNLTVFDIDSTLNTGFAGGVLTLDLGYSMGLDAMGALHDPANLPDWAARAQFSKLKTGFNYARPFRVFNKDASFSSQLTGQKANNTLYGSEQIAIGGLYSVRGFVRNVLSGDDGYYLRNEISVQQPMHIGGETMASRIYVGYDTGEVRNRPANIPQGRLAGMAIGIAVNWRGATWEFFNTRPLTLPSTMTKESSQTWFRVVYAY